MVSKHYLRLRLNTRNSDQDSGKLLQSIYIDQRSPILEASIFSLFKIDLINLIKTKVALSRNFYIQPSEIDRMYFWEYEYMVKEVDEMVKEENKRNEETNKGYDMNSIHRQQSSMMSSVGKNMKMPSMPKMPSIPHI